NLNVLRSLGIATVGAGPNLAEARKPVVLVCKGMRIAFLGYASVFPIGYEARESVPGVAPLRAHTHYFDPTPLNQSPGSVPRVFTFADPGDLEALSKDIDDARRLADLVVVSCHWGDALRPSTIFDYERQISRAAIDFGAGLVLCHHHHIIRGVEMYRGVPIFHGLGHFVLHLPNFEQTVSRVAIADMRQRQGDYGMRPYSDYPLLPMHP